MINLNTAKALLKDEREASKEYAELARKSKNYYVMRALKRMSEDEAKHADFWEHYIRER